MYRRNQNLLVIVYGKPGAGKSYTCLKLARLLDPNFTLANVVFDVSEFFNLLHGDSLHKGSVVIFEELGVAANSRDWYKDPNKMMSFINQVFRTRNLIVFYTVPRLDLVDGQLAKLTHAHIEADHIDYKERKNFFKIYDPVEWNDSKKKWYRHQVSYRRQGRTFKVKLFTVKKIRRKLAFAYEAKRKVYEQRLTETAKKSLDEAAEKEHTHKQTFDKAAVDKIVSEVILNRDDYMQIGRFNTSKVMDNYGVGRNNAKRIKDAVREKMKQLSFHVEW